MSEILDAGDHEPPEGPNIDDVVFGLCAILLVFVGIAAYAVTIINR